VNITILPSINTPDYEGYARAAVEEGVKIFETAGHNRMFLCATNASDTNNYGPRLQFIAGPLIKYFKVNNCIILHKCTTIRHAKVG
jgi:hypothetical protein